MEKGDEQRPSKEADTGAEGGKEMPPAPVPAEAATEPSSPKILISKPEKEGTKSSSRRFRFFGQWKKTPKESEDQKTKPAQLQPEMSLGSELAGATGYSEAAKPLESNEENPEKGPGEKKTSPFKKMWDMLSSPFKKSPAACPDKPETDPDTFESGTEYEVYGIDPTTGFNLEGLMVAGTASTPTPTYAGSTLEMNLSEGVSTCDGIESLSRDTPTDTSCSSNLESGPAKDVPAKGMKKESSPSLESPDDRDSAPLL